MPSTNPTLRVVVTESEKVIIEAMAKQAGKSVSAFLKDLALGSQQVSQPNRVSQPSNPYTVSAQGQVSQPVCVNSVGAHLPLEYELKPHEVCTLSEYNGARKVHSRLYYIYLTEQIVAIKQKSANGAKSWLEVAITYPEDVWLALKDCDILGTTLDKLIELNKRYNRLSAFNAIPEVAEAIAQGWEYSWLYLASTSEERYMVRQAAKYLSNLPKPVIQVEPVEPPITLSAIELSKRLKVGLTALMEVGGKEGKEGKVLSWTASNDPNGTSWLPIDVARKQWQPTA